MKILLVDDDPTYREITQLGLEAAGMEVTPAEDGPSALSALAAQPRGHFDVLVLDVQMPGPSGWELLDELREAGDETPVVYLTGLEATEDKLKGLGLGADDYVVKSTPVEELVARLQTVVRRRRDLAPMDWGELRLDLARRRVTRGDAAIELSPREFDLLYVLVKAKGGLVSRAELLQQVWEMDFDPGTNLLDVHIGRLRKKVDRHGRPLILNERGQGYRVAAY